MLSYNGNTYFNVVWLLSDSEQILLDNRISFFMQIWQLLIGMYHEST